MSIRLKAMPTPFVTMKNHFKKFLVPVTEFKLKGQDKEQDIRRIQVQ